jgi:DNA-binding transcriptional LysR family regulator
MGLGVALLPRRCAQGEIARKQLLEVRVPDLRSPRELRARASTRRHAVACGKSVLGGRQETDNELTDVAGGLQAAGRAAT